LFCIEVGKNWLILRNFRLKLNGLVYPLL